MGKIIKQIRIEKTSSAIRAGGLMCRFGPNPLITIRPEASVSATSRGLTEIRSRSRTNKVRTLLDDRRQPQKSLT